MGLICKYSTSIPNGKPSKIIQAEIGFCRRNGSLQMHIVSKVKTENIHVSQTNIKRIHSKHKKKGKATIEFKNPDYTLMICEAPPKILDKFLRIITITSRGERMDNIDSDLNAAYFTLTKKDFKIKQSITNAKSYPINEGFSANLIDLSINTRQLKRIDMRWFALNHLTILDLSNNKLGLMNEFEWKKFSKISRLTTLTTLNLSNNGITELPSEFVHSIPNGLTNLLLSNNELAYLPDEICDLRRLIMFFADNNPLDDLPEDFFNNCRSLKRVGVSGTNITTHPSTLRDFQMDFFSSNAIGQPLIFQPLLPQRKIPTLFSFASAKIYDYRAVFFSLPLNVRFRMRRELFRCDDCFKLFPKESKRTLLIQPLPATSISTEVYGSSPGVQMRINLIDSNCSRCYLNYAGYFNNST
uniref:Leucine-rich repeat protein n=1 Tax=Panagrolaimus davidi TaxID=227884 RepID=A0A914PMW6_9BILA